jgi:hypothetical protein
MTPLIETAEGEQQEGTQRRLNEVADNNGYLWVVPHLPVVGIVLERHFSRLVQHVRLRRVGRHGRGPVVDIVGETGLVRFEDVLRLRPVPGFVHALLRCVALLDGLAISPFEDTAMIYPDREDRIMEP